MKAQITDGKTSDYVLQPLIL